MSDQQERRTIDTRASEVITAQPTLARTASE